MLPTRIRSVEKIRGRWIRDYLGPAAGLVEIASASARHLREPGDIMLRVQEASHELDSLPDQIKSMIEARPANEASHPDRKVHFFIEFTSKGNLRVSYFPERPAEFGQETWQYKHHEGYDPVNSLLFFRGFHDLWVQRHEVSSDPDIDVELALVSELVSVVVQIVQLAEVQVSERLPIIRKWEFRKDARGKVALFDPDGLVEQE